MVRLQTLDLRIGVRVPASQPVIKMALSKFDPPSFESVPFVRLAWFESIEFSNGSRRHIRNSPPFQEASCSTRIGRPSVTRQLALKYLA